MAEFCLECWNKINETHPKQYTTYPCLVGGGALLPRPARYLSGRPHSNLKPTEVAMHVFLRIAPHRCMVRSEENVRWNHCNTRLFESIPPKGDTT